jgi:predicted nucleic acid-binding protein
VIHVVDATVVFKLSDAAERFSRSARALFADSERAGDDIVAPSLLWFEMTDAIRKRLRRDRLTLEDGLRLLADFELLPITRVDPLGLHREALRLTQSYSLGGQDAHYVALAQILGCDLGWTMAACCALLRRCRSCARLAATLSTEC